ncbi:MAG TPA: SDR family oxidoreductase [Thermohalobaculum sp.]|nr:SDR family oxidoreductase [Thermohalobaculum sp.]
MAKTTLITGANRGIGLALTQLALERGDRVLAAARRPGQAPALADLARKNKNLSVLNIDVTDPEEMAAAAALDDAPIDLLICNAGQYLARGGLDDPEYTFDAWHTVMMTNVAGIFFTVRAFMPRLLQAPAAKIAIVSSMMASNKRAPGGSYIYRASKAAATNLARNLATDLKPQGIAVGAYHPGWVRTDMGGPKAAIEVEDSAKGLMQRFDTLSLATTGVFEDYRGEAIPF